MSDSRPINESRYQDLSDTLMRIGRELGLEHVTAENCIGAIRALRNANGILPEVSVPALEWRDLGGRWDAHSTAGRYVILSEDGRFRWGIDSIRRPTEVDDLEAAKAASADDLRRRRTAAARTAVSTLSWFDRDDCSFVTSRVARYRVDQINIGENTGEWMVTLHDREFTKELFPTREAAKACVQEHWVTDHQILYALPEHDKDWSTGFSADI